MASERVERQVQRLLDEAERAFVERAWDKVRERASDALTLDPDNGDAKGFLEAANRALGAPADEPSGTEAPDAALPRPSGRRGRRQCHQSWVLP